MKRIAMIACLVVAVSGCASGKGPSSRIEPAST